MPITVMSNALQRGATVSAIEPTPKMPMVLPVISRDGQDSHVRLSWFRTLRGIFRLSASIAPNAASDIGLPCTPWILVTVTSSRSEGRSAKLSTPVPMP